MVRCFSLFVLHWHHSICMLFLNWIPFVVFMSKLMWRLFTLSERIFANESTDLSRCKCTLEGLMLATGWYDTSIVIKWVFDHLFLDLPFVPLPINFHWHSNLRVAFSLFLVSSSTTIPFSHLKEICSVRLMHEICFV